jgi:hypothetical protein
MALASPDSARGLVLAVTTDATMRPEVSFRRPTRGAVVDETVRPDLPEVSFDWNPQMWGEAARRAVELVVD